MRELKLLSELKRRSAVRSLLLPSPFGGDYSTLLKELSSFPAMTAFFVSSNPSESISQNRSINQSELIEREAHKSKSPTVFKKGRVLEL